MKEPEVLSKALRNQYHWPRSVHGYQIFYKTVFIVIMLRVTNQEYIALHVKDCVNWTQDNLLYTHEWLPYPFMSFFSLPIYCASFISFYIIIHVHMHNAVTCVIKVLIVNSWELSIWESPTLCFELLTCSNLYCPASCERER